MPRITPAHVYPSPAAPLVARKSLPNVRHSSKSAEWGSTPLLVECGRLLMGGIDCDPASAARWNKVVRAKTYYTARQDGLRKRWFGRVWLNPPSGNAGALVQAFWIRLIEHYLDGLIEQACFVGFSLDQLVSLQGIVDHDQRIEVPWPLAFPTAMPSSRVRFLEPVGVAGYRRSTRPSHGNFVSWLPPLSMPREVAWPRFLDAFGPVGRVTLPVRDYGEAMIAARALDKLERRTLANLIARGGDA